MSFARVLPVLGLLLLGGCVYHIREKDDAIQCDLAMKPFDRPPPGQAEPPPPIPGPYREPPSMSEAPKNEQGKAGLLGPTDLQTTAFLQGGQVEKPEDITEKARKRFRIPSDIPGSETPLLDFYKRGPDGKLLLGPDGKPVPMTREEREAAIKKLYPELPPLPEPPPEHPGPGGQPFTLAQLQEMAAKYSWALKEAISDVDAARGTMIAARAYPNPTLTWSQTPSSSGLSSTTVGVSVSQPIKTGGKLKEQEAAAREVFENAELALKRARSDLSTAVRNAYFAVLVARETVRVNRAVSVLTDEVYRIQVDLAVQLGATYEPSVLQGQADIARVAYEQSIQNYIFAWSQLVATIGLRECDLPLSEVGGRIDAFVPIYDYHKVLDHVLTHHTDVLSARHTIEQARYNLKLQQITPWFQDLNVAVGVQKDFTLPPGTFTPTVSIGMPLSVWDQNKGNIISNEAALVRALEGPHQAEMNLTKTLAMNFVAYRNNLIALERYRQRILPEQVRAYRGVFERRYLLGAEAARTPVFFADLVNAQQALTSSVSTYLGILGSLWSSVVSVADLLQTDDLFGLAHAEELPEIPDLEHLLPLPCSHECPVVGHPEERCACPVPAAPAMIDPRMGGTKP
jgi:cobalt-zinc-cadmium efflux system outer membrane protein